MTEYNMYEAKTNLCKIARILENKEEDVVIISRKGKPLLKVSLAEDDGREGLFGCGKGVLKFPESIDEIFDDIDISDEFDGDIL